MIDLRELYSIAFVNLKQQRLRSVLTLLGVVIGIAAIVALISIGQGMDKAIEESFEGLGINTIIVLPGTGASMAQGAYGAKITLDQKDVKVIESINHVTNVAPVYFSNAYMEFGRERKLVGVMGIEPEKSGFMKDVGEFDIMEGRFLEQRDTYEVMIGEQFAESFFDKEIMLRDKVYLDGVKFNVVGLMKQGMSPVTSYFIIVPFSALEKMGKDWTISRITATVFSKEYVDEVKEEIEEALEKTYNEGEFTVMTMEQVMEQAGLVLDVVQVVLIGIAAISLLVGGIGIMNTMLMAVMERRKEIGVMKAIGATRLRITVIFLAEASLIGLVGGVIGLLFGYGLGNAVALAAAYGGVPLEPVLSVSLVAGALLFSMVVGAISGVYPAVRASKLDPVETLRFE